MANSSTSLGHGAGAIHSAVVNEYSIIPKNLSQYTAFRGIIDFTQIGQFDQFETGYSFLSVIQMPRFMTELAKLDPRVSRMVNGFKHMLEYEFRGISGLPDVTSDTYEIGDGANTVQLINNVSRDTSVSLSSPYYERRGSLITKFMNYYLTGIKDPMSKAKTYHGLIANDKLDPSLENEVATMMYFVTDNTFLRLEKAYLLCDCQFTKAEESMYDSTKGDMGNKELSIEWNCFPVTGYEVDAAAKTLLEQITGVGVTEDNTGDPTYNPTGSEFATVLDSYDYHYGVLNKPTHSQSTPNDATGEEGEYVDTSIPSLVDAVNQAGANGANTQ